MMSAATYTSPITLTEFQSAIDPSACGAGLGRRCPAVNLYDVHAVPLTFVRQLTDKLSERRIADRLCQVMIALHTTHVQVLDEYRSHLAIVRQFMRDLVQKIMALVPDLRMALGDYMLLSGSVVGSGLFPGEATLLEAETMLRMSQCFRTDIATTIRTNDITAVQVNANARISVDDCITFQFLNSRIYKNGGIIPVSGAFADGDVLYRSVKRTMQHGLDVLALRNGYRPVLPVNGTMLQVVKRLPGILTLRNRMVGTMLPPVPETVRTLLDCILQGLGVHFVQPWIYLLERDKLRLRREAGHTVPAAYPVHRHIVQRTVVCNAAATEAPGKELGLLRSRIETVFVCSQHITNLLKFIDNHKEKSTNHEQISFVISQPVDPLILRGIRRAHIGKNRGEVQGINYGIKSYYGIKSFGSSINVSIFEEKI